MQDTQEHITETLSSSIRAPTLTETNCNRAWFQYNHIVEQGTLGSFLTGMRISGSLPPKTFIPRSLLWSMQDPLWCFEGSWFSSIGRSEERPVQLKKKRYRVQSETVCKRVRAKAMDATYGLIAVCQHRHPCIGIQIGFQIVSGSYHEALVRRILKCKGASNNLHVSSQGSHSKH